MNEAYRAAKEWIFGDGRAFPNAEPVLLLRRLFDELAEPKIITLFALHTDSERSLGEPFEFYIDENRAVEMAKGRGWYGGAAPCRPVTAIVWPDGRYYLLRSDTPIPVDCSEGRPAADVLKERALAKLSLEERRVLGLS